MNFLASCPLSILSAGSPSAVPHGDADSLADHHEHVREVTEAVLSRPEFADLRYDQTWWLRFIQFMEKLARAINWFFSALPGWLWWTVVIWLILTLLAIFAHFAYVLLGLITSSARGRAAEDRAAKGRGELLGIKDLEFQSVYRRAREFLAAGDWSHATRYLYVAAILWLDQSGWVKFRASKTNADYLRELSPRPEPRSQFQQLTRGFELTVYGGVPCTSSSCGEMATIVEGLVREGTGTVSN